MSLAQIHARRIYLCRRLDIFVQPFPDIAIDPGSAQRVEIAHKETIQQIIARLGIGRALISRRFGSLDLDAFGGVGRGDHPLGQ
ncbi:hypothetical protein [Achromobacter ruhlandii]|uniref:hypothetical protein n=1 Tax=Achromobacter ruhlandii TaxID=72557 RepID=UPI00201664E4|nr:hypothetical protein [Achromobacter ruhlandii]